jgi:hypothetical protein
MDMLIASGYGFENAIERPQKSGVSEQFDITCVLSLRGVEFSSSKGKTLTFHNFRECSFMVPCLVGGSIFSTRRLLILDRE